GALPAAFSRCEHHPGHAQALLIPSNKEESEMKLMTASSGGRSTPKTRPLTDKLLLCGAIAGPLFLFTVLNQDFPRPWFDPRLVGVSLLSVGYWGWVQIVNFLLAGGLNLLLA